MDRLVGEFYVINTTRYRSREIDFQFDASTYKLYEVLRIIKGIPLFLEDHTMRLKNAIHSIGYKSDKLEELVNKCIGNLIRANGFQEGNIKLICSPDAKNFELGAYFIPHSYPGENDYNEGVQMITRQIDRPDPNLKQVDVHDSIRDKLQQETVYTKVYDVLLYNSKGNITEGSKSNFFLIKNSTLYSAPDETVLKGITRHYVLKIARDLRIKCVLREIDIHEMHEFSAAFLCGTSPKILPVSKINDILYDPLEPIIQNISTHYNQVIDQYIEGRK